LYAIALLHGERNGKKYGAKRNILVIDAETGMNFIDVNIIELKRTGFMSNRDRQNVASFFMQRFENRLAIWCSLF
jgi:hypothetical protein